MPRTKQFDETEILEKATALFWKQGYHATSIQNLVDHLGINRASIYATFGDKNKLYESAVKAYRTKSREQLEQSLAKFDSAKEAIKTLFYMGVKESFADKDAKGCFMINCTSEYLPLHQHIITELVDNKNSFEQLIGHRLQKGKDNGEFSQELAIPETASYLFTFFSGLKISAKIQKERKAFFKTVDLGLKVLDL